MTERSEIRSTGFVDEPYSLQRDMLEAVARVIKSGKFILGESVSEFERQWSEVCGTTFAVGVANGLDALEISLRALDIGPGDEVITTPLTAFATYLGIVKSGATPILADVDPQTGLLSRTSVKERISSRTRAVVLVHLYGQMRDMQDWLEMCTQNNVQLIEDCAQAHAAEFDGKKSGSWGVAGAFSFYPTKNLGALGDAGALTTNSADIAEKSLTLRNYGQSELYLHDQIGLNSRLDEIQAALLLVRLGKLEEFTLRRRDIAEMYWKNISNYHVELLLEPQQSRAHVYHQFVIRSSYRNELRHHLERHGIHSLIHYPRPVHKQPAAVYITDQSNDLSNAEEFSGTCLSIPCHPQLQDSEVLRIAETVNEFVPKGSVNSLSTGR